MKQRRLKIRIMAFAVVACVLCGCDVHDYWMLSDELVVNSDDEKYVDRSEPIKDDLFVRYQFDYAVANQSSSQTTEVVVSGTSYVNGFTRAVGQKVWRIEPGTVDHSILTSTQLEYGNSLQISLSCCNRSLCGKSDVLCPDGENLPQTADVMAFCYDACHDQNECLDSCPALEACRQYCKKALSNMEDECIDSICTDTFTIQNCQDYCNGDEDCLGSCTIHDSCRNNCASDAAGCYMNCVASWNRCAEDKPEIQYTALPCSLCSGGTDEEMACQFNDSTDDEDAFTISDGTNTYSCGDSLDCNTYPAACANGCDALFDSDADRIQCLHTCLAQHLFWCNDAVIPTDFVNTNYQQPCCYETYCDATLSGIVKTFDIECFNDSSCSSNHVCSSEGVCIASGASNCASAPLRQPANRMPLALIALALCAVLAMRRQNT